MYEHRKHRLLSAVSTTKKLTISMLRIKRGMKTLAILVPLLAAICFSSSARAKSPNEMTVLDCYLLLPQDFLQAPPSTWLRQCRTVDEKSGYMRCNGDDAQPNFHVALFRYADGRPMLAVCQGQLNGNESRFLDFFSLNSHGEMQELPRAIFPIGDADENVGKNWFFELPRQGHTILVHDQTSGKVTHKITWSGEKFVEEK